jgi:adenine/guanine phosphoribosyltransferase-like PRPP-binding protein|tara:strand:+ start:4064 stop:4561 length:498 start_codon:yes stop_codon:yes gene_type:complete
LKQSLDWVVFKEYLLSFADEHRGKFDKVYGISRKGMVPATMLAIEWGMELGVCRMKDDGCMLDGSDYMLGQSNYPEVKKYPNYFEKFLFVDDVVAQGRTIKKVRSAFQGCKYLTIVQDKDSEERADHHLLLCDKEEWVVFPWERFDKVKEMDRGLYRDGTSTYGT